MSSAAGIRGKRVSWLTIAATLAVVLAITVNGTAATTYRGKLVVKSATGYPPQSPDWALFVAGQCADQKDGVSQAYIKVIPAYKNKSAVLSFVGQAVGAPVDRRITVKAMYGPCTDPSSFTANYGTLGTASGSGTLTFTIPLTAQTIILQLTGSSGGLVFGVDYQLVINT